MFGLESAGTGQRAARGTFLEWKFHQPPIEKARTMNNGKPLNEDMQYLNGRVDALSALLLAVAGETMNKEHFRSAGNARLESLERTLLNTTVSESHLQAIAHTREWLNNLTG